MADALAGNRTLGYSLKGTVERHPAGKEAAHLRDRQPQHAQPGARPARRAALTGALSASLCHLIETVPDEHLQRPARRHALRAVRRARRRSRCSRASASPTPRATSSTRCSRKPRASPKPCWRRSTRSATRSAAASTRPPATVTTPPGFKQAYAQFVDGGWTGLASPVGIRRPGPAARRGRAAQGNDRRGEPGLGQLPAALARRHRSAAAPRRGVAAGGVPASRSSKAAGPAPCA